MLNQNTEMATQNKQTDVISKMPAYKQNPPVDIYETGDSLVIMADMPGVKEADLKVEIVSNQLTLDGVSADGEVAYFRKFQLPERIDTASGEAHLKDGVLTLRLSRAEEAKPKRIAVKTLH